jgi:hypothetical protein
LEAVVNDYIRRELVQGVVPLPLANAAPLLETGVLDSLNRLKLGGGHG